jgi:hypothetical protein
VPRARVVGEDGKTREWKSKSLRAYQRRTKGADALIAGAYLVKKHKVQGMGFPNTRTNIFGTNWD